MMNDAELLSECFKILGSTLNERLKVKKLRALFSTSSTAAGARKKPAARPTRLAEDWRPSADLLAWAADRTPLVDLSRETERFVNYWVSRGKPMVSWDAAWRNWMLKAADEDKGSGRYGGTWNRRADARAAASNASRARIVGAVAAEIER
jgi:hypothetical protein